MIKTYSCAKCGEFDIDCNMVDKELKVCPKCNEEVKRIFKPPHYSWKTDGFAGKGFD